MNRPNDVPLFPRRARGSLAGPLAALALTACQIVSHPPSSSRGDGGPVVTRGQVTHEARSQLRLYRDAAGCESVQTVNQQFRLVTVVTDSGPTRLVLAENYDIRRCLTSESASSEATVTAWRPTEGQAVPLFRLRGRGASGEPLGNLYRMTNRGCCGSQEIASYYSLITGEALFTSSVPLRSVEVANRRTVRYAAFHDSFSAGAFEEATRDSSVIGVLQWGDDRTRARRVLVRIDRPEGFAASAIRFENGSGPLPDSVVTVWPDRPVPELAVVVELVAPISSRRVAIRVPIVDLDLAIGRATVSRGVSLSPAS